MHWPPTVNSPPRQFSALVLTQVPAPASPAAAITRKPDGQVQAPSFTVPPSQTIGSLGRAGDLFRRRRGRKRRWRGRRRRWRDGRRRWWRFRNCDDRRGRGCRLLRQRRWCGLRRLGDALAVPEIPARGNSHCRKPGFVSGPNAPERKRKKPGKSKSQPWQKRGSCRNPFASPNGAQNQSRRYLPAEMAKARAWRTFGRQKHPVLTVFPLGLPDLNPADKTAPWDIDR